ncbi:hypothetical protein [Brevifollis gellanilyticus]|nr:hypothetical protein [Brevifollis gellanilyticus]
MNAKPVIAYRQPPEGLITSKILAWFSHWLSTSPKSAKTRH